MSAAKTTDFRVVGLTFVEGYPANLMRLHAAIETAKVDSLNWGGDGDGPEDFLTRSAPAEITVLLVRNPENEHDENAIEVHVPSLGRRSMIGHVPRDLAARFAPTMDRGDIWTAALSAILVDPEHPDKPGAEVTATWKRAE